MKKAWRIFTHSILTCLVGLVLQIVWSPEGGSGLPRAEETDTEDLYLHIY